MTGELVDVHEFLTNIEADGGVIIRGFRSADELLIEVQSTVDLGRACAFAPSQKTMRHFFNVEGFRFAVQGIEKGLKNHSVEVEAGSYAGQCLFVVKPNKSL